MIKTHEEKLAYLRQYRQDHKQELAAKKKIYLKDHPEVAIKANKHNYESHKERYKAYREAHKEQRAANLRRWQSEHKQERHDYAVKKYQEERPLRLLNASLRSKQRALQVLTHYGNGGKCACVRCGFDDIRALSIDHINGDGAAHRCVVRNNFYSWLIKNNYPDGFQTLCFNCQWIKRAECRELPTTEHNQKPKHYHMEVNVWQITLPLP